MQDILKVLILTHNYPRFEGDFSGIFVELLARRLTEHNIKPFVLAPHDRGASEREESGGVSIRRFRYARDENQETLAYRGNMHRQVLGSLAGPLSFRRFLGRFQEAAREIIGAEQIDVVAGHWLIPAGIIMKAIRTEYNLPMVLSSHGTDIRLLQKFRVFAYPYFKGFLETLSRWTMVSDFLKNVVLEIDDNLADRIAVFPLPHNEAVFYRDASIVREEGLIISVTRFTEQKRVHHLVRAFAQLADGYRSLRLEIYGTGPLQSEIEQLIKDLNLGNRIKILSPVPQEELRRIYNRASMVVLNSFQEGFGLTLSEAMMCGAPVIGSRSGGITDIISHEHTGLLVEPDGTDDLANAIDRLAGDHDLRERLAEKGQLHATKTYASAPLTARYARILREAVQQKRSSDRP